MGASQQVRVTLGCGQTVDVQTTGYTPWQHGDQVTLQWQPRDSIVVIPDEPHPRAASAQTADRLQPHIKQEHS